ncbi:phosphatase PAP2 family protein [Psychromicrobium xiongbiense]|uniref:phosphatase PAP2 family protein n=1 Tax=Psychromicrobium xiongbiense TaxID=3051184 RepID=UPI002552F043|nr:phosphatase PAP2 family protein [Psychromicrobium sp. YIM S02556]
MEHDQEIPAVPRPTRMTTPGRATPGAAVQLSARNRLAVLPEPRHWFSVVLPLFLIVLALGILAKAVPSFSTTEFGVDQTLSQHHVPVLNSLAKGLEFLFGPAFGALLVVLIGLFLFFVRRSPVNALAFVLVACSGWVVSEVFKLIIARQRPDQSLLFDPLSPETGSNSFPSGHTSFAVALALACYFLARQTRWKIPVACLAVVIPLLVGWSRLYIGVHYPTDVIAAILATLATVTLFAVLWNRFAGRLLGGLPIFADLRVQR